ncbi:hypothetical protein KR054_009604, partial [Drosophila jambulina]
ILDFMVRNPDLARGYIKGNKVAADAKWSDLKNALNAVGPPIKDVGGWKKVGLSKSIRNLLYHNNNHFQVWCDWRTGIRKKITNNRAARANGGGPYTHQVVTEVELELARVCEMLDEADTSAHGSPSTVVVKSEPGDEEEAEDTEGTEETEDTVEIEEYKVEPSPQEYDEEPRPKRRRGNPAGNLDLQALCTAQLNVMTQLSSSMTEHFKRMEELHKEDIAIKKELLS